MTTPLSAAEQALRDAAREYHLNPTRGKISVSPTKPLSNQRDLSLAYSPGVAYPCLDIQADPSKAFDYTARGNLVGVITNGTAVLGLGNIGPLAAKPVMEGKGCLFKKFAGVDVFDIELDESDPDKLIDIIAALEPTLGGIILEDIKAPECFQIERQLRERLKIPVFHDDQHGTAIISSAALINALELVGKRIEDVKLAVSGAGAAAIACLDVMVGLGVKASNIFVCDSKGVVREGRGDKLDESKQRYCQKTEARTLADVVKEADVFLGCSAAGVLTAEMIAVPCWSSWNTGMFRRSRSCFSMVKHSGALMSSRLTPPSVGSSAAMISTSLSGSRSASSMSKTSMPANFLNRQPLPSITGLPASGPMSPRPSTAVPLVTTPTRLARLVYSAAHLGSSSIARQA